MNACLQKFAFRALILSGLICPAGSTLIYAQTTAPQTVSLNGRSSVDEILQALYLRGQNLQDFTAKVDKTETDTNFGKETSYLGTIRYRRKPDGNVEIRAIFDHIKLGENPPSSFHQEYELADGKLIIQKYDQKLEDHMVVAQPGQKINPLRLGEGAFPLPVGQEPQEVKKQFDVKVLPPTPDDPVHTIHAQLIPKAGTRLANKFQTIDIWVDTQTNFTPRIETVNKNGITITTTNLTDLKINSGLKDADFQLPPPGKDWSIQTEELDD